MKELVAEEFQFFVYSVLRLALNLLGSPGIEDYMQKFLEMAISSCYFRVPEFRELFLMIVQDNEMRFEIEMRKTGTRHLVNYIFDWQKNVYHFIPEDKQRGAQKILVDLFENQDSLWRNRLKNRGNAFFDIIKAWAEFV